jgi:hypothetical protein
MKTRYFIQSGIQTDIALESSKYREEKATILGDSLLL